jgi:CubicO group peptidase (beta-lactamase class C family)
MRSDACRTRSRSSHVHQSLERTLILLAAALAAIVIWTTVVFIATRDGWLREPLAPRGDAGAFVNAAAARLEAQVRGNVALRLLERGEVVAEHFASIDAPVDADTRFQVASVSKWVTAVGVMTLVDADRVSLDAPVSRYLRRWTLPPNPLNDEVTVRRLLSHTAGLTDGLGYNGFAPGERVQLLEESLTRAADAMPGADGIVRVGSEPGAGWLYSGGGYGLLQLLIEEVSGTSFENYMQQHVLQPLGMNRSTFDPDRAEDSNLAGIFGLDGSAALRYRFAVPAAAGLYSTAVDLTRFVQAHLGTDDALPSGMLTSMRAPHGTVLGVPIWGLGVLLYAPNGTGGFVIGHDGYNAPAINATVRVDPATGDAIIVLATGTPDLATSLGSEWVFWHTGSIDVLMLDRSARAMIVTIALGAGVIALAAVLVARRRRRP